MTTIVYRSGVLAADTRAWSGDKVPIGFKRKIHQLKDGSMIGISSAKVGEPERFLETIKTIESDVWKTTLDEDFAVGAILVSPAGDVYYFNDSRNFVGPLTGEWLVIGSGEEYAIGALSMGASAEEAVKVAAQHDPWTAGEIHTLRLTNAIRADEIVISDETTLSDWISSGDHTVFDGGNFVAEYPKPSYSKWMW